MVRCGSWALFLITAPSRLLETANFTVKNDSGGNICLVLAKGLWELLDSQWVPQLSASVEV